MPFSTGSTARTIWIPVLKAALAHLWFVTIHPFEDGNGRIARAIADMSLARSETARSASTACPRKSGSSGKPIMTCLKRRRKATSTSRPGWSGFSDASIVLSTARKKRSPLFSGRPNSGRSIAAPLNERQRDILNRLLDGFDGKLTSAKWATHREMFAGYCAARYHRSVESRHSSEGRRRRTQHELFAR